VTGVKLAKLDASFDRATRDASIEQLAPSDKPVLALSHLRNNPSLVIPRDQSCPPPTHASRAVSANSPNQAC
jgi:hypothetical protein